MRLSGCVLQRADAPANPPGRSRRARGALVKKRVCGAYRRSTMPISSTNSFGESLRDIAVLGDVFCLRGTEWVNVAMWIDELVDGLSSFLGETGLVFFRFFMLSCLY